MDETPHRKGDRWVIDGKTLRVVDVTQDVHFGDIVHFDDGSWMRDYILIAKYARARS